MSGRISNKIITDGLVLYLDAANNESYISGSTIWNDLTFNNNTGTLTNRPTYNSSNGGSIVFNGINNYVDLGNSIDFSNYINGFSIGFWIKVINTSQINRYLFSKRFAPADNQFSIIYGYVNNTFELYSGNANQNIRTNSQISVNDNNWHFIQYTVGPTTTGYLDNIEKFNNIYPNLSFPAALNYNTTLSSLNGVGYFGNLSIASSMIYNRLLTQPEILQNYNALKGRFGL